MMIFASKQALLTQAEWLLHRSTNDAGDRSDVLSQAAIRRRLEAVGMADKMQIVTPPPGSSCGPSSASFMCKLGVRSLQIVSASPAPVYQPWVLQQFRSSNALARDPSSTCSMSGRLGHR